MGVDPVIIHLNGIFHHNPLFLWYPHLWEAPYTYFVLHRERLGVFAAFEDSVWDQSGAMKLYVSFKIFKKTGNTFLILFFQSHKSLCRLGKLIGTWSWLELLENRKHMTSKSFHTMSVSHILQTGMARTKRQGWHLNDPSLATGVTGGHPKWLCEMLLQTR